MIDFSEPLMTSEELCTFLGYERETLYTNIPRLKIPYIKVGNLLRFERAKIAEWLVANTKNPVKG